MSITDDQYQLLLTRLRRLENTMNDLLVASGQYITLGQMNQLVTLIQTDVDNLRTQVTALEDRVTSIEEEPLT